MTGRVLAWAGKELKELVWLVAASGVLVAAMGFAAARLEVDATIAQRVAQLTLAVLAAVVALIVAQRQSRDLRKGTLRHVLSFPLRPGELLAGKLLAALAGLSVIVLVGVGTLAASSATRVAGLDTPAGVAFWVGRVVLLASVPWSLELAADSWPRTGLAVVLSLIAVYALALVLARPTLHYFNVFLLVPVEVSGRELVGAALAGGVLAGTGLAAAGVGLCARR